MTQAATDAATPSPSDSAVLGRIAVLIPLLSIAGLLAVARIGRAGVLNPGTGVNTFFEQYRRHEPVSFVLMSVFAIGVALAARRANRLDGFVAPPPIAVRWGRGAIAAVSVLVLLITAAGTVLVMHAFPLAMDEYVARFQASAFAEGKVAVPLPAEWQQLGWALKPVFVVYDPDRSVWLSAYWPLYGMLRALFVIVGGPAADVLVNPVLAALSVPLVYACARRLWPNDWWRPWAAVGFLVLSTQFLFMSMSGFAMPSHLFINLLWLYAFLREDRAGWLAAPVIGVVALGLHNPFPHALFVAPFLIRLLLSRKPGWTAYFAAVYLAGIAVWFAWAQSVTAASAGGTLLGLFARPGVVMAAVQEMSLTIVLSWQTPLLAVLLIWLAAEWRSLTALELCLGAGVALSFLFFFLFPSTQGHGWGYRYTYPVLGNMALLGVSGLGRLAATLGGRTTIRLALASALATMCLQVPVRAWQIEHYVRPFAMAHDYVAHIDADVVIVDPTTAWYGIDFIRNDPFLRNRPKILSGFYLRPNDKRLLAERFGNRVHLLTPDELARFGIPTFPSRFRGAIWPPSPPPTSASR